MATRKRSGSGSKRQLKEKVVQIYESFFRGEDLTSNNPTFWDELFLLKPKVIQLEAEIQKLNPDQLSNLKDNINLLFSKCVDTLNQEHQLRIVYSLQTLSALASAVYRKMNLESGSDIINTLIGLNAAEVVMQQFLNSCNDFLSGDAPDSLKTHVLKLLLVIVTGKEEVNDNPLLEYFMITSLFEALFKLLSTTAERQVHGHDAVLLLTILVNYKKDDAANPYIVKLSILDDELALNGYGQVITSALGGFCSRYGRERAGNEGNTGSGGGGWLSSLTSMVGGMFLSGDDVNTGKTHQIRANNAVLLALYEAAHLNRNFMTTLAHTQSDRPSAPPSPVNTLSHNQTPPNAADQTEIDIAQPTNLLVTFFQYCSIVMQDTKTEPSINNCKLCFLILTCISEDQYANSIMHDCNLTFKVQLHRLPMRHRKVTPDKEAPSQTLAATLIDLLVEFVMSHMMKRLPMELYLHCIGVVHRLLCYQKRCRVRLDYQWKELWSSMISLLKFVVNNESNLSKKMDIFFLCLQIINIFNIFITYGDTFLPTPASYDQLYYELIRMHQVFDNLYSMALRYSTSDSEYKEKALKLANCLFNIKAIIKHFTPKIESWLASQSLSTPNEDQILEVVRKNYEGLMLKLQDSLDKFERYGERPLHSAFLQAALTQTVRDTRTHVDYAGADIKGLSLLHEGVVSS
ncbi:armadillo-like helical domain-containing protein 3 isoform X2 [Arctopsyche grandis]